MLSRGFSTREKILLVVLVLLLLLLAWYLLVFQNVSNRMSTTESEIAEIQTQTEAANIQLAKKQSMQKEIDKLKSSGTRKTTMPKYDNINNLMAQLNTILAATQDYTLSFDDLDFETEGLVKRGVTITFGCQTMADARSVMTALEQGAYPCSIDSASMQSTTDRSSRNFIVGTNSGRTSAPVAVGLHAVFLEQA